MAPWIVISIVGGALSATAGFFTRALWKKTTHLEDENKQVKAQVASLLDAPQTDKPKGL